MVITWLGKKCLKFEVKRRDGAEISVVLDPFEPVGKLKLPRSFRANVIVSSDNQKENVARELVGNAGEGEALFINLPGEYERSSFFITGREIITQDKKVEGVLYRFDADDLSIGVLTALRASLTEEEKEFLEGAAILVVLINGEYLPAKMLVDVCQDLEPQAIVPIGYDALDNSKTGALSSFTKLLGVETTEVGEKWKVARAEIEPLEGTMIVKLTPLVS